VFQHHTSVKVASAWSWLLISTYCQGLRICGEAYPTSYPVDTRDLLSRNKLSEHGVDYSSPSSAKVKNVWSFTSTPLYNFTAWSSSRGRTLLFTFFKMSYINTIYIFLEHSHSKVATSHNIKVLTSMVSYTYLLDPLYTIFIFNTETKRLL